ncbi:DNA primase family protein [Desulfofustis limnaeus]|uniref:Primase n=1 Tax=Desulfofustis limnaeus TaxID=2740163 RepID=A0ABM7WCP1_9BACT|nr:phage/plasmid primase, P4 family [Desulfofustis limnaeus]BDD88727.1 primase [Desulfofustis limnaeus]
MPNDAEKLKEMRRKIDEARQEEEKLLGVDGEPAAAADDGADHFEDDLETVDKYFVSQCFKNNERGDGTMFARLNRDRYLYVKITGEWLMWVGHHWSVDKKDYAHNAVDLVAQRYEQQCQEIEADISEAVDKERNTEAKRLRDLLAKYKARIKKLRGIGGARACLEWSHKIGDDSLAIVGDEVDQQPMLLPCKNGVIDLKTGKLKPGRPGDYLVKAIPIEWQGIDAPRPTWERVIDEIHVVEQDGALQSSPEIVSFIRRLFGYAITGLTTEHFIACFVGEGRNGKGTMFEVLRAILGDLAWAIQPELILEQKNTRSSAGPSPDMVSLQGRRMVIASETDENRRVSGAKVKMLTGSDTICARSPHDRFETNFRPTHKLFLYTNHIPGGLTRDYALVKRLLFLQYPLKYVDNPSEENERQRDPLLIEKLMKEAPGILAWLVQGCLEWQQHGLAPPEKIRADVEQLRRSEDTFEQFFLDVMEKSESNIPVKFAEIYQRYKEWYVDAVSESTTYMPSKKKISAWLERRGYTKDTKGGTVKFTGLAFRPIGGPA